MTICRLLGCGQEIPPERLNVRTFYCSTACSQAETPERYAEPDHAHPLNRVLGPISTPEQRRAPQLHSVRPTDRKCRLSTCTETVTAERLTKCFYCSFAHALDDPIEHFRSPLEPRKLTRAEIRGLRAVVAHESGHCVVALVKHVSPSVAIRQVDGEWEGDARVPNLRELPPFDACAILLSGRVAEDLLVGPYQRDNGSDLERAQELAKGQPFDLIARAASNAKGCFMTRKTNRDRLELLASNLIEQVRLCAEVGLPLEAELSSEAIGTLIFNYEADFDQWRRRRAS